jgi:hypothetical protein
MSVLLTCPNCHKRLKVGDNLLGRNVKCPGCATAFPAKALGRAAPKKAAPPPDDEDEAPRRPARAARRDDEDERPAKKKAKKRKSSAGLVLAIGGAVVLLLLLGGGVLAYIHHKGARSDSGAMANAGPKVPANGPAGGPPSGPKEPVGEPLAGPRPATFPDEWEEFKSDEPGFRVMLPGTPKPSVWKDHNGNPEYTFVLLMTEPGAVNRVIWDEYMIHVRDYPEAADPRVAEAVLKTLPQYAGPLNFGLGKTPEPLNVKVGTFAGKPGRAWDVKDGNGGTWHIRACFVGTRAYRLIAGP